MYNSGIYKGFVDGFTFLKTCKTPLMVLETDYVLPRDLFGWCQYCETPKQRSMYQMARVNSFHVKITQVPDTLSGVAFFDWRPVAGLSDGLERHAGEAGLR